MVRAWKLPLYQLEQNTVINFYFVLEEYLSYWRLVFKITNNCQSVYDTFMGNATVTNATAEHLALTATSSGCWYKHPLVENWSNVDIDQVWMQWTCSFSEAKAIHSQERTLESTFLCLMLNLVPFQVKMALYEGGEKVATLVFDGKGSNKTNWFSQERVLSVPWVDLSSTSCVEHFSIEGFIYKETGQVFCCLCFTFFEKKAFAVFSSSCENISILFLVSTMFDVDISLRGEVERRFYINNRHYGCEQPNGTGDAGWLFVVTNLSSLRNVAIKQRTQIRMQSYTKMRK